MIYRALVLLAVITMAVATITIGGCDKLKNITGNLAGQIVTPSGTPIGYYSVALIDVATGAELQRQNAADRGNFMFRDVPAGTYIVKIYDISKAEVPADCPETRLGTGRTKNIVVTLRQ